MPSCSLRISLKISEHDRPANGCGNHSSTHSLGLNDVSSKFTQHLDMCVCRGSGSPTDCAAHLQHRMHIRWIYVGRFLSYIHIYIFVVCPATGLSQVRLRLRLRFPLCPPDRQLKRSVRNDIVYCRSPPPAPLCRLLMCLLAPEVASSGHQCVLLCYPSSDSHGCTHSALTQ